MAHFSFRISRPAFSFIWLSLRIIVILSLGWQSAFGVVPAMAAAPAAAPARSSGDALLSGTDLTELDAADWSSGADQPFPFVFTTTISDDLTIHPYGSSSVKFDTDSAFDWWIDYPQTRDAGWDLSQEQALSFWIHTENPGSDFQAPLTVRLVDGSSGDYLEYTDTTDLLDRSAQSQGLLTVLPLAGSPEWQLQSHGTASLSHIDYIEIHADTYDSGFTLWLDGLYLHGNGSLTTGPQPLPADGTTENQVTIRALTAAGDPIANEAVELGSVVGDPISINDADANRGQFIPVGDTDANGMIQANIRTASEGDRLLVARSESVPYLGSLSVSFAAPASPTDTPTPTDTEAITDMPDGPSETPTETPTAGPTEPLNVISFETRPWSGVAANSPASAIAVFNSLPPGDGDRYGKKDIPSFGWVSNQSAFSPDGSFNAIAFHVSTRFSVTAEQAGSWQFRVGPDFGGGGTLLVDGQELDSKWYDIYWNIDWGNTAGLLSGGIDLAAGDHTVDVYGFEDCCDGGMGGQFKYGDADWQDWSLLSRAVSPATETPTMTATPSITETETVSVTPTNSVTPTATPIPHSSVVASANKIPADGSSSAEITVTVLDENGSPVDGAPVDLTTTGHATLTQPDATGADGTTQATITDASAETVTLTAKSGTATIGSIAIQFVRLATDPNHSSVNVSAAATLVANNVDKATFTVTLLDRIDRPEAGHTVRLFVPGAPDNIFPSTARTNSAGMATFRLASTHAGEQVVSVIDDTDQITMAETPHLTFVPGPVNAIQSRVAGSVSTAPADGITSASFVVTAYDAFANPIPGAAVVPHVDGNAQVDQASATTNSGGQAVFAVTDANPESVTVSATIDGAAVSKTAQVRFRGADASVQISALAISNNGYSATTAASGFPITYTITVSNLGLMTANNVTVTDNLPAALSFTAANPNDNLTQNGNELDWSIGQVPPGVNVKLAVTAQIGSTVTGLLLNSATAALDGTDDTPDNNTGQGTTMVEGPQPVISLSPGSSFAAVTQGASTSLNVTVRNSGLAGADGLVITSPPSLSWVGVDTSETDLTLAPGAETSFQVGGAPGADVTPGYYRDFVTVASPGNGQKLFALTLQVAAPKHTLQVHVQDDQGARVPGAEVVLQNSSDYVVMTQGTQTQTYRVSASAQADANGVATFSSLEAGNYDYLASAAKHTNANGSVALPATQDADATITLAALPTLNVSPNTPVLSVVPGANAAQTFTIQNDGSAPLQDISISLGSDLPDWVYLGTPGSIPAVDPGKSFSFSVFASPPADEARSIVGGHLTVSAAGGLTAPITFTTRLEAVNTRPLIVQVKNVLGQPVTTGGTVILTRQDESTQDLAGVQTSYHEQYSQGLGADGTTQFADLPLGAYNYDIEAPSYKRSADALTVNADTAGGQAQVFAATVQTDSFNYQWSVDPVQAGYDVHLTLTYDSVTAAPGLFIPPRYWTFRACDAPEIQDTINVYNPTDLALDLTDFSISVPGTSVSFGSVPPTVAPHSSVSIPVSVFRTGEPGEGTVETPFSYQGAKDPYVTYTVNPSSQDQALQLGQTVIANYSLTPVVFTPGVVYAVQVGQPGTLSWLNVSTASSPGVWDENTSIPLTLSAQTPSELADGNYQDEIPVTVSGSNGAEREGKLVVQISKNGADIQMHTSYQLGAIPTETRAGSSSGFIESSLVDCNSSGGGDGGTASSGASGGGWVWDWVPVPGGFSLQGSQTSASSAPVPPPFPQLIPPAPIVYGDDHQEVRLGIDQHVMLEGEGFHANLLLNAKVDLANVNVDLKVTDPGGFNDRTGQFTFKPGVPATLGDIAAGSQASQDWTILPSGLDVTASQGQDFEVSAVISWVDTNGEALSIETAPTQITVLPAPDLEITYNLPRGNEQCTTFPLQVLFHNVGAGTARNVHFSSAQPELVDGTQSPLSFTITKASVNNVDQGPSLNLSLGDIPPNGQTEVDFTFSASQPGKFVEFTSDYRQSDYAGQALKPLISKINTQLILSTVCGVLPVVSGSVEYPADTGPLVTLEALDHSGLGIKQILYSFDNILFTAYTLPFIVLDPLQTHAVFAIAEDNAGNRSDVFQLEIAPSTDCPSTWSWCNGQDIKGQPQFIDNKPHQIDVMALTEAEKLQFAHAISEHCWVDAWCDGQVSLNSAGHMDHDHELTQNEIQILFEAAGLENTDPNPPDGRDHLQEAHDFARMLKAIAYGEGIGNEYRDHQPRQFLNFCEDLAVYPTEDSASHCVDNANGPIVGYQPPAPNEGGCPDQPDIRRHLCFLNLDHAESRSPLAYFVKDQSGNLIPIAVGDDYVATGCKLNPRPKDCSPTFGIGIMQLTFNIKELSQALPGCAQAGDGCSPIIDKVCTDIMANSTGYSQAYNQIQQRCVPPGTTEPAKGSLYHLPQGVLVEQGASYPGGSQVNDDAWSGANTGWQKDRLECSYPYQTSPEKQLIIDPNQDSLFAVQVEALRAIRDPYYNICKAAEALQFKQKLNTDWCRVTDISKPGTACETAPRSAPPLTYGTNPNDLTLTKVDLGHHFLVPQNDYDRALLAGLYKTGAKWYLDFLNLVDPKSLVTPIQPGDYSRVSVLDDSSDSRPYYESRALCRAYTFNLSLDQQWNLAGRNKNRQLDPNAGYYEAENFVNYSIPPAITWFPPPPSVGLTLFVSGSGSCRTASESLQSSIPPANTLLLDTRIATDGQPIVEWKAPTVLTTKDCGYSRSARYTLTDADGMFLAEGTLSPEDDTPEGALTADLSQLAPYHGTAHVKIDCGKFPADTQITDCKQLDNLSLGFLGFDDDAKLQVVCDAVKAMGAQVGGEANFLNLAYDAAWNVCQTNPGVATACPPASDSEDYKVSYAIDSVRHVDNHWFGLDSQNAEPVVGLDIFAPRVDGHDGDPAYATNINRSYMPDSWRNLANYQDTTVMHETTHMLESARPGVIEGILEEFYTGQPDYWFLYPGGLSYPDYQSQLHGAPKPSREVAAQVLALAIEYGSVNQLTITNLNDAQLTDMAAFLSGGPTTYPDGIVPLEIAQKAKKILTALQPSPSIEFDIYVDPSGYVKTTAGDPITGATVTLYSADSPDGTFSPVVDGSVVMSSMNRHNPDTTDAHGLFGWDVLNGYYKVRAEKDGCVSSTNAAQPYAESDVVTIPPAVLDLDLRLDCPQAATDTPTPAAVETATETPAVTDTGTPVVTDTATATETPTEFAADTATPTETATETETETPLAILTDTATPAGSDTPTETNVDTPTLTEAAVETGTPTLTLTPGATDTEIVNELPTPTETATATPTSGETPTPAATVVTSTLTATVTSTASTTPTAGGRATRTPRSTRTPRPTRTPKPTRTSSPTATVTRTRTPTPTRTRTPTRTPSPTRTPTRTRTATPTRTPSRTVTPTPTSSPAKMAVLTLSSSVQGYVTSGEIAPQLGASLANKLKQAITRLDAGQTSWAINRLNAFISETVTHQKGNISQAAAADLRAQALSIIGLLSAAPTATATPVP